MFHRLFKKAAPVKQPTFEGLDTLLDDFKTLRMRVKRLEITEQELLATQDSLQKQLQTVRGMITGGMRKGPQNASGVESIAPGDKDALRAYAGLSIVRKPPPGE